jgi:hypothetical protein
MVIEDKTYVISTLLQSSALSSRFHSADIGQSVHEDLTLRTILRS